MFANGDDARLEPAIGGYELLGLSRYAASLRALRRSGYTDRSRDDLGERFDERFERLSASDRARARLIRRMGDGR